MASSPRFVVLFAIGSSLLAAGALAACGSDATAPVTPPPASSTDGGGADDASVSPDGGPPTQPEAGAPDAAPDAPDYGQPSAVYPAFPVDAPQVVKHGGGRLLTAPVVVTITWDGDTLRDAEEKIGDELGSTSWWSAATSEYGIGPLTSGPANHVHVSTPPPATVSFEDLDVLVTNQVLAAWAAADAGAPDGGDAGEAGAGDAGASTGTWPAPTDQTLYALYLPPQTTLAEQGTNACDFLGAYHQGTFVNGVAVAYAVMPRCPNFGAPDVEIAASHELVEAATDPDPQESAYVGFDDAHLAQHVWDGTVDEVGDACYLYSTAYYTESTTGLAVQRTWSNAGVKAGHDPCAPAYPATYANVTTFPDTMQTITVNLATAGGRAYKTRGYATALNTPITFPVGFFSEADTNGPFDVSVKLPSTTGQLVNSTTGVAIGNGAGKVSIDRASGVNGQKAYVTFTPQRAGDLKFQLLEITSTLPGSRAERKTLVLVQNL